MKRTILTLLLFGAVLLTAGAQSPKNKKQVKAAEQFIHLLRNQEFEQCWKLVDQKTNPDLDKDQFLVAVKNIYELMPDKKEELELYMNGIKFMNNRQLAFYSYKYKNDISKSSPGYLLDITFADSKSTLIAGVQPKSSAEKSSQAASSKGEETIVSQQETWIIDSTEFKIRGVNIIHFEGNSGIMAVQVEQVLPDNIDKKWAYQEGIKFSKYLYQHTSYSSAIAKAKELNMELLTEIGVSFINPDTGQGYNILIKSDDYK